MFSGRCFWIGLWFSFMGVPCSFLSLHFLFVKKITFIYLFWLCPVLVTAYGIFHCVMRTLYLVPWLEIEPGPPALATGSFSHWITREVTFPYASTSVAGSGFILRWPASRSPGGCHTRRQQVSTRPSVDAGEEGCEGGKGRPPHACLLYLRRNTFPGGRSAYISLGRRGLMASVPEPQVAGKGRISLFRHLHLEVGEKGWGTADQSICCN